MWHGEVKKKQIVMSKRHEFDVDMDDQKAYIIFYIRESSFRKAHIYDTLRSDKDTPLYKG